MSYHQVITAVTTGKVAFCGKLHPHDDKQNIVLCGMADKKIVQWDLNSRDIVQARAARISSRPHSVRLALARRRRCMPLSSVADAGLHVLTLCVR